jgi:hypothetical protein
MTKKRNNKRNTTKSRRSRQNAMQTRDLSAIADNTAGMTRAIGPIIPDQRPMQFTNRGQLHTFSRKYVYGTITASTSVDQAGVVYFTLSAFPNSAEFSSLFDEYRVLQTQVEFITLTTGPYVQPLSTIIDYDDANAVANLNELLEYETCMTTSAGANHIRADEHGFVHGDADEHAE